MSKESKLRKRISGKTELGNEFSVSFEDESQDDVILAYFEAESTISAIEIIEEFRKLAMEFELGLFVPSEGFSNQMEKLCIAACASYPNTLPSDFIETRLEIPYNSYKVYATAKDHESSRYLTLDDNKGVEVSFEGILWTKRLLGK
jgi:hypothetical protein